MFSPVNAYLCQPDYVQAMLICLRSVEQNRPAMLADVNPELVINCLLETDFYLSFASYFPVISAGTC